jgi:hypothetical protein
MGHSNPVPVRGSTHPHLLATLVRTSFFFATFHLAALTALATTILVFRTPDQLILVADSKPTFRGEPGPNAVCKITPARSGFLAIAGLEHDTLRGFDSRAAAAKALESSGSFLFRVAGAEVLAQRASEVEMARLKVEDPDAYRFSVKNGGSIFDLVIASVEGGIPLLAIRRFHINEASGSVETAVAIDCPGNCPGGRYFGYLEPAGGEAEKFLTMNSTPRLNVDVLRDLVLKQIIATPNEVGPPIEILNLDHTGARWIENDLGCSLTWVW